MGAKESPACPCVSLGAVWGDGLSGGYLPAGPDFSSSGTAAASLPFSQAGWGVFSAPLEKTEIFLTAPEGRNPAALSDLSDERSRRSRCVRSSGRVGRIPDFRDS